MRLIWLSAICVVFLTGCAPTRFAHPTKGDEAFYADKSDCEYRALQTTTIFGDTIQGVNNRRFTDCMRGRGWRPVEQ